MEYNYLKIFFVNLSFKTVKNIILKKKRLDNDDFN